MTIALPYASSLVAAAAARVMFGCVFAVGGGAASAASIDDMPTPGYAATAPGDIFQVRGLDEDPAQTLLPDHSVNDVDEVLRRLNIPRPEMEDDHQWFDAAEAQPLALQPETLLRGGESDVWLSGQDTTRRTQDGPGLRDVLRSIVNVSYDAPAMEPDASTSMTAPVARNDSGGSSELLRDFVTNAIEPYRRADGSIGFSIFGVGDFYAETDRGARRVHLVEENTGWSFDYRRANASSPPPPRNDSDDNAQGEAMMRSYGMLDVTPVGSEFRLSETLREYGRWLRDSLLVKLFLAAWLLYFLGNAFLRLGRALNAGRRASQRVQPTSPALTTGPVHAGGLPTPPPALAQQRFRHPGARRARRRSPTLRNLLRSLGLG